VYLVVHCVSLHSQRLLWCLSASEGTSPSAAMAATDGRCRVPRGHQGRRLGTSCGRRVGLKEVGEEERVEDRER